MRVRKPAAHRRAASLRRARARDRRRAIVQRRQQPAAEARRRSTPRRRRPECASRTRGRRARGKPAGRIAGSARCMSRREREARGAAEQPEQQVLDQRLPHQPRRARAERGADRQLAAARRRRAPAAGSRRWPSPSRAAAATAASRIEDRRPDVAGQRLQHRHRRDRRPDRCCRTPPSRPRRCPGRARPRAVPSAAACSGVTPWRRRPIAWNIEIEKPCWPGVVDRRDVERHPGARVAIGKRERRRHHADDGVGRGVEAERLADDVGAAAEALLPEAVRQDDDRRRARAAPRRRRTPARARAPPAASESRLGVTSAIVMRSARRRPGQRDLLGRPARRCASSVAARLAPRAIGARWSSSAGSAACCPGGSRRAAPAAARRPTAAASAARRRRRCRGRSSRRCRAPSSRSTSAA